MILFFFDVHFQTSMPLSRLLNSNQVLFYVFYVFFSIKYKRTIEIRVIVAEIVKVREFPYGNPRPPYIVETIITMTRTMTMTVTMTVTVTVTVTVMSSDSDSDVQ